MMNWPRACRRLLDGSDRLANAGMSPAISSTLDTCIMSAIEISLLLALLAAAPRSASAAEQQAKPSSPDANGKNNIALSPPKRKAKFTIGKDTTYVTGPLDKDGYIDYTAALNERLRRGVTPENNANVLLWKALGPTPGGEKMAAEFFQWLGIKAPPEQGEYFIDLSRYIKDHLKIDPGDEADAIKEQLDRSTQRCWTANEYPHVASWLKANEKPLALVIEATKRPQYFSPLVPTRTGKESSGLVGAPLGGAHACRELATALAARALLRAGQGAVDDAWQDLLACHRLGRLVGRAGTLIEGLTSIAIENIACQAELAFLDRAKPTAQRIQDCLKDLHGLPPLADPADQVGLGERFMFLDALQTMAQKDSQPLESLFGDAAAKECKLPVQVPEGINWDAALRVGNRWYDRIVAGMHERDRGARKKKFDQIEAELKTLKKKVEDAKEEIAAILRDKSGKELDKARSDFLGETIGHILMGLMLPSGDGLQQSADRTAQVHDNLVLAFALVWYQRDHGHYPKGLPALTPKYLGQVPQDRFSGKALVYHPTDNGFLLYSVGVNGKDDNGRGYDENPPGDDLSVRMPLPELRRK
jgi:hypothetical protein